MANFRSQAWLTYVTQPEHVHPALMLSHSLQRTLSTRRRVVVVSSSISTDDATTLGKSYDDVFYLKPVEKRNIKEENQAKIFALSLSFLEKLVLLEPCTIFLENCDRIFEDTHDKLADFKKEIGVNGDYYLITPSTSLSEHLKKEFATTEIAIKNGFGKLIENWRTNGIIQLGKFVRQFSLEIGNFLERENSTAAPIVRLIDGSKDLAELVQQMTILYGDSPGLTARTLAGKWLQLYHELENSDKPVTTLSVYQTTPNEPIAIVGMSCRLPGANNLEEFWNLLYSGESAIRPPPPSRWGRGRVVTTVGAQERNTHAGFLKTPIDEFDAKFFGVSPKEAAFMDPQTRILHEVLWESLESAGIIPSSLEATHTGIFTGSWLNDYRDIVQCSTTRDFFRTYMGNGIGAGAARLSFLLGVTGPCVATESGCSSANVAVDLAVKSLRCGETKVALAGGVNLLLHPFTSNVMNYVIAPDGRCKTFDAKADGFGRAEGCGFLVLKRMSDALRDGDHIWALIRGSAVSQEGISRSLGTPTVHSEALAMQLALKNGGVNPEEVGYLESHGTGTPVGDPLEVKAVAKAYNTPNRTKPLIIGSVKTNVGHTESCSGITGIIKTVLALQQELIPQHLNLETLNPEVDLEAIPAQIPLEPQNWPRTPGQPRLAGVSSFGITGTDGHVILQEAPDITLPQFTVGLERPLHLMKFSAKSPDALEELLVKYRGALDNTKLSWEDVAFTANFGRADFEHRAFLVAGDMAAAREMLAGGNPVRGQAGEVQDDLCFLFPGQGSQYPGMGNLLYDTNPVFRFHFDQCDDLLKEEYGLHIKPVLWGDMTHELSRTIYSQTSIFVVEYCLLKLWESWGITPRYVLGHSLGEFCAAVCAGLLTFPQALKLVVERSRLIDKLPSGSMLVLKANETQVQDFMNKFGIKVDFAALNSDTQTVVAGDTDKIHALRDAANSQGIKGLILDATHAFHSSHMNPILETYRKIAQEMEFGKSSNNNCQFISGMEGTICEKIDADYWVRHTRDPVNFLKACKTLQDLGASHFLEVGSQPVLSSFVLSNAESHEKVKCHPSLRKGTGEWDTILSTLGNLWIDGHRVDWQSYDKPYNRKKVGHLLPFYPFQRKTFWVNCTDAGAPEIHPLLGAPFRNASAQGIFQKDLNLETLPYLKEHCIGSKIVFPGAAFTEMLLVAGYAVSHFQKLTLEKPRQAVALRNVKIMTPLELKEDAVTRVQVLVSLQESTEQNKAPHHRCQVHHRQTFETEVGDSEKWVEHATAEFYSVVNPQEEVHLERVKQLIDSQNMGDISHFYKRIDGTGLKFGSSFQSILEVYSKPQENLEVDEVVAKIRVPDNVEQYLIHPLILDAFFQTQILAGARASKSMGLRVPVKIGLLVLYSKLERNDAGEFAYIHAHWKNKDVCKLSLITSNFQLVAQAEGIELLETNVKTIQSLLENQNGPIPECWEETWKPIPNSPYGNRVNLGNNLAPCVSSPTVMSGYEEIDAEEVVPPGEIEDVDRLVTLYAYKALQELGWKPTPNMELTPNSLCADLGIQKGHFQPLIRFYFTAFRDELNLMDEINGGKWRIKGGKMEIEVEQQINLILKRLLESARTKWVAQIYQHVGENLVQVLTGKVNALSLLFPENDKQHLGAETFYHKYPGKKEGTRKITHLLGAVSQQLRKNLSKSEEDTAIVRVLEVGAGTGSMSMDALRTIKRDWGANFEYYYTDISNSFFIKAESRVEEYKDQVKFAVFNIEEQPLGQGIPVNYFDWCLSTDVLHATRDLRECLANLRLTLRPGGLLSFTETVRPDKGITFVFGILEGYWRFQDFDLRPHHSCVSSSVWKELLECNGFGNVWLTPMYAGTVSMISAEANSVPGYGTRELHQESKKGRWLIFLPEDEGNCHEMLHKVGSVLQYANYQVDFNYRDAEAEISQYFHDTDIPLTGIIYARGMSSTLHHQNQLALPLLCLAQNLLQAKYPAKLFVLTKDVYAALSGQTNNPSPATLWGMMKSLKNENSEVFVRCVDLSSSESCLETWADQVLYELALHKTSRDKERVQIVYQNGQRLEPRFNRVAIAPALKSDLQLPPSTNRFHLELPRSRQISDLEMRSCVSLPLKAGQVEIEVRAYALNFRDLFAILKPSAEFEGINSVGTDFSGVVCRLPEKETKWKIGDRVFGVNTQESQLSSHITMGQEELLTMPQNMNFNEACTLPTVYATSIHCLLIVAQLQRGETVLIHTGSGGVGLSAIQLALGLGANIITTAGSVRKRSYLRSLGVEHVFHSRNTDYVQGVKKLTNGNGVNVVLNSLTGPGFKEATLECCAQGARFVEMSKLSVWTKAEVKQRRPDVHYFMEDLSSMGKENWADLMSKVKELLGSGTIASIPYVRFDAMRLRQALEFFQRAKHIGKVVVSMPRVKVEQGQWKVALRLFDADSTYLITGGLGGIGFEVCKWMLEKGATDLVLTGRHARSPLVQNEIDALNQKGNVNVRVILADVGNAAECTALFQEIKNSGRFKPLRGVQHCAGVLSDNLYPKQSWSGFESTFNPKVNGTWNLHKEVVGLSLEHFVLYSSFAAMMGPAGQANHVAANCFEDAFAHYRHSLGLPATTINWGQWAQVGCAKDVNVVAIQPVSVRRMLNGLEEALRSPQRTQTAFCEFESLRLWAMMLPGFKYYLDERLLRSLKSGEDDNDKNEPRMLQSAQFWAEVDGAKDAAGKMEIVTNYLKIILRKALRMEAQEPIKEDALLQDVGVDSLMLVELRNSIQSLLGNRFSVDSNGFKDCQTIRQLATVIVNQIMAGGQNDEAAAPEQPLSPEEYERLLREDCFLDPDIHPKEPRTDIKPADIRTLLITGATGQLGPYLLAEISQIESVTRVICLVRTASETTCPQEKLYRVLQHMKLFDKVILDKIECVRGDVSKENFGLGKAAWEQLGTEVDCVVHLATKSNHVEQYHRTDDGTGRDIRCQNVGATRNVLRFAVAGGRTKSVPYASSLMAVWGAGEDEYALPDLWPIEDDARVVAQSGARGYPASKFVGEMLIKEAVARGIPCKVFRYPWIMGEKETGQLNYQSNHYVLRFLTYLKLKAMLRSPIPAAILPVDTCAEWTVQLFWNGDAPCEIYNIAHPAPQLEVEFVEVAKKEFEVDLDLVDWTSKEITRKMAASDMPLEAFQDLYDNLDNTIDMLTSGTVKAVQGYLNFPQGYFRNRKLARYLPNFGTDLPSTMDILVKDLKYVQSTGFFAKLGLQTANNCGHKNGNNNPDIEPSSNHCIK